MGRFYGIKVKNGDIVLEDVPALWRSLTRTWLKNNP